MEQRFILQLRIIQKKPEEWDIFRYLNQVGSFLRDSTPKGSHKIYKVGESEVDCCIHDSGLVSLVLTSSVGAEMEADLHKLMTEVAKEYPRYKKYVINLKGFGVRPSTAPGYGSHILPRSTA